VFPDSAADCGPCHLVSLYVLLVWLSPSACLFSANMRLLDIVVSGTGLRYTYNPSARKRPSMGPWEASSYLQVANCRSVLHRIRTEHTSTLHRDAVSVRLHSEAAVDPACSIMIRFSALSILEMSPVASDLIATMVISLL